MSPGGLEWAPAVRNGPRRSGMGPGGPESGPAVRKVARRSGKWTGGPEGGPGPKYFVFLSFSVVSLFVDLQIKPVRRGSSVGIATCYGLDGPGIESGWERDFPHQSRPALGSPKPPIQWVPLLTPGVKRLGRGVDHPPHLAPRLKKE